VNLDLVAGEGVDVVADLDRCRDVPLPFADDSFEEFRGSHVLEHLHDPLAFMRELYRIAKPGATALFLLPYGSSDDAFEDPTHVRPWFVSSFGVFAQVGPKAPPHGYHADWIAEDIVLDVPATRAAGKTQAQILDEVSRLRNVVTQMRVTFRAQKPPRTAVIQTVSPAVSLNVR